MELTSVQKDYVIFVNLAFVLSDLSVYEDFLPLNTKLLNWVDAEMHNFFCYTLFVAGTDEWSKWTWSPICWSFPGWKLRNVSDGFERTFDGKLKCGTATMPAKAPPGSLNTLEFTQVTEKGLERVQEGRLICHINSCDCLKMKVDVRFWVNGDVNPVLQAIAWQHTRKEGPL